MKTYLTSLLLLLAVSFAILKPHSAENVPRRDEEADFWPDLVGHLVTDAVSAIKLIRPDLDVFPHSENAPMTRDYRYDRVRVIFSDDGKVKQAPRVG